MNKNKADFEHNSRRFDLEYSSSKNIPKSKTPLDNNTVLSTDYEPDESLFKEFLLKYKTNRHLSTANPNTHMYSGWTHGRKGSMPHSRGTQDSFSNF